MTREQEKAIANAISRMNAGSEGVTLEQKKAIADATARQSNPLWSGFDQFGSGFLQGMGDELKAATAASKEYFSGRMPFSEAYSQALPQYQRAREDYRKANPVKGPALEIGGAVAPWLLSAGLLPPVAAGANIGAKVLHGAKIGTGTGAVSGGLMAEGDILDRAKGAVVGGTLGGTLGAVATPVIAGAVGTGKFLINQIVSRLPHQQRGMASRKIAEALARDGLTPDQAAAKLQEMGPNASILDLEKQPLRTFLSSGRKAYAMQIR